MYNNLLMHVVVKSAVTGPDLSQILIFQHNEVPHHRYTFYPTESRNMVTPGQPLNVLL